MKKFANILLGAGLTVALILSALALVQAMNEWMIHTINTF
jgi:hypothetical protein